MKSLQKEKLRKFLMKNARLFQMTIKDKKDGYFMKEDFHLFTLIETEYGEYSEQEIQMVKGIKRAVAFIQSHHRPMTTAELRKNRAEIGVTNNYEHK